MKNTKIKKMVILGLMLAIEIVLSRFLSIQTATMKLAFNFIPVALVALMYGPIYAGCVAGLGDFIGAMLFQIGPYFPGYTLSAFLSGIIYGLFLYGRKATVLRSFLAALCSLTVCSLGLNSLWIYLTTSGVTLIGLMPQRLVQYAVMLAMQTIVVAVLAKQRIVPLEMESKLKRQQS